MSKGSHARLPITIASWDYDRARALIDGRVEVEGCEVTYLSLAPEECFHRAWAGEFDVSELGISSFLVGLSRGESLFVGIPVFLSRSFRHSGVYIRDDRGIDRPEALRGKRVGVPTYEMAAALWIRGFLNDDYGVKPADMQWIQGGLEVAGRQPQFKLKLPDGFPLVAAPDGATLNRMLADGEIDALVSARAPSCLEAGAPHVRRLFPDFREVERAYFERTHIFPIMHVCGVRRTLVEQHPWLAASLVKAYVAAKGYAEADLREVAALKIELPWVLAEYEATVRAMGTDYWPYGVDANRATLEALLTYSHDQGLTPRRLTIEEMFAPTTLHASRI